MVLDMATAAITFYGVVTAKANGTKLPPGVAIDAQVVAPAPHPRCPPFVLLTLRGI